MDKVAKAITGALVAGYAIFEFASTPESAGGYTVTGNEWVRVAVSAILGGLAVWAVPNTPTLRKL